MGLIPSVLIDALKCTDNYGRSVGEVASEFDIEIGSTGSCSDILSADLTPYSLSRQKYEVYMAVARGLAQIFNQDRRQLSDPRRWEPR